MLVNNGKFAMSDDPKMDCFRFKSTTYTIVQQIASNVFTIHDPVDGSEKVMKICKARKNFPSKMARRFVREIDALKKAKASKISRVIDFLFDGAIKIGTNSYRYYVMERADCNLRDFLENNTLDVDERYMLCVNLLQGLKELHDIDVYHRDIKPENVLFVDNYLKIADLGLIAYRKDDNPIDKKGDKIGPFGWHSPEVMNKVYNEGVESEFSYDCDIDEKSDIFQLGKLYWYIFQGNLPIGQVIRTDFKRNLDNVFEIIFRMTQYSKDRRSVLADVETGLASLAPDFNS